MSDDDLVRRGDARDFLTARLDAALAKRGVANHRAMTDAVLADVVPALPSASAPAERLARAVDEMEDECCGAGIPQYLAANGWKDSEAAFIRMLSALSAFRAAPEPAPTKEPAKPEPCRTCQGHLTVSDCITHTDYDHDTGESREWGEMVSRPCPDCRPGGDA